MRTMMGLFRNRIWRHNISAGLAGVLLGGLFGCALILSSSQGTPVVVIEERQLNGDAHHSGHLDLYIDLDRSRNCPAETSRWLWTWVEHDGEKLRQYYPLVNTATTLSEIGHQHFILSVPIPPGVWPGQWYYWSKTVEHCSFLPFSLHSPIRESADIPVHILGDTP